MFRSSRMRSGIWILAFSYASIPLEAVTTSNPSEISVISINWRISTSSSTAKIFSAITLFLHHQFPQVVRQIGNYYHVTLRHRQPKSDRHALQQYFLLWIPQVLSLPLVEYEYHHVDKIFRKLFGDSQLVLQNRCQ